MLFSDKRHEEEFVFEFESSKMKKNIPSNEYWLNINIQTSSNQTIS